MDFLSSRRSGDDHGTARSARNRPHALQDFTRRPPAAATVPRMTPLRIAGFLTVLVGVSSLVHRYLWMRLVRDLVLPPGPARVLTVLTIAGAALLPLAIALGRYVPRPWSTVLGWVAFVYMGLVFFALVFLGLGELGLLGGRLVAGAPDDEKRRFLGRVLGGATAGVSVGLASWGVSNVRRGPVVKTLQIPLQRLARARDGYRIVQVTDVHVGPLIGVDFIRALVAQVNAQEPDLVVITGDLVDGSVAQLGEHVAPLKDLRAKDGVFFVTGNHEYFSGADEWVRHLPSLGIRVLRNEHVRIGGDDGFDLAGVDDTIAHQFLEGHGQDVPKSLAGRDAARPVVLLAHQPKAIDDAVAGGVDLMLSGHTHGGQMKPFHVFVRLAQPFIQGLHKVGGTWLYVSPGTGFWGPPMRLGTECEVTRLELRAAPATA